MTSDIAERDDDLLDVKEAAALLQIKPGTLDTWRVNRRYPLPFVRIGARVRYRRGDLRAFIAQRTVTA